MAATASESAPNQYGTQSRCVAGLGHPVIDVSIWCDVHLVLGPDIQHTFINGIGVETGVA